MVTSTVLIDPESGISSRDFGVVQEDDHLKVISTCCRKILHFNHSDRWWMCSGCKVQRGADGLTYGNTSEITIYLGAPRIRDWVCQWFELPRDEITVELSDDE